MRGEGVTTVKKLSDYYPGMKDSINDCKIYIFEGKEPGGTLMVIGGSHPEEPAANLTAELLVETAQVEVGRLIVAIRANRSASTVTRPGDAYPQHTIPTAWGENSTAWRSLDQSLGFVANPEIYVHYPNRQCWRTWTFVINRTWPGYPTELNEAPTLLYG